MHEREFAGIYFDDQHLQAQFEALVQAIQTAEQLREPLAKRHQEAEKKADQDDLSDGDFRQVDDAYIAANNKIAAAKKAVDAFLAENRNYKVA